MPFLKTRPEPGFTKGLSPEKREDEKLTMLKRSRAVLVWLISLFDPPPLNSMTFNQKVGRVLLFTATLVVGSIVVAMVGALGVYIMEKGRELGSASEFLKGVGIVLAGIVVNVVCVVVLLRLKKADQKLLPPSK